MDSPQSVASPLLTFVTAEPEKSNSGVAVQRSSNQSNGIETLRHGSMHHSVENAFGFLEVHVHQARDIHNICIYHKQDVYARLCLTSDPENTASTNIINGGGRNPVFNEKLCISVRDLDSSLKCELFMMSRAKNYLEDQLLGFTMVPLSEVMLMDGKLGKEFPLSSSDLFHSPAGFIGLSLAYTGASPEVMAIAEMPAAADVTVESSKTHEPIRSELDKIEFPDLNMVNENEKMVSEYFGISRDSVDSESYESFFTCEAGTQNSSKSVQAVSGHDSPPSSVSVNAFSSPMAAAHSCSRKAPEASKTPNEESVVVSAPRNELANPKNGTSNKPVLAVNIEPEQNVVQQEIVDMYMKSMQQFTESLAKMKLPLDIGSPTGSENSSTDPKVQTSKNNGSRVFYGSRAFF